MWRACRNVRSHVMVPHIALGFRFSLCTSLSEVIDDWVVVPEDSNQVWMVDTLMGTFCRRLLKLFFFGQAFQLFRWSVDVSFAVMWFFYACVTNVCFCTTTLRSLGTVIAICNRCNIHVYVCVPCLSQSTSAYDVPPHRNRVSVLIRYCRHWVESRRFRGVWEDASEV